MSLSKEASTLNGLIEAALDSADGYMAESDYKYREALKSEREYKFLPLTLLFQGLLAGAALFGAGVAFTKLFL